MKHPELLLIALALAACDKPDRRPPRVLVAFTIEQDRLDGVPGSPFRFATTLADGATNSTTSWTLGDGRSLTGQAIEVTYDRPGLYEVIATVSRPGFLDAAQAAQVRVFDPAPGGNLSGTEIAMPALFGDVDLDTRLTAADVHLVAKVANGLAPLPLDLRRSADFDLSGTIDLRDARLLAQTVAADGQLPSALHPMRGPRGAVVSVMSRHLLDVASPAVARVGDAPARPVLRVFPGRANILIPMDAVGTPTIDPIVPATIPIVISVNNIEVERFDFSLENPPEVTGSEPQLLADALDALVQVTEQAEQAVAASFEALGQTAADRAILQSFLRYALVGFREASLKMNELLPQLSTGEARQLGYVCNIAGLQDLEPRIRALGSLGLAGPIPGSTTLKLLCAMDAAAEIGGRVDTVLSAACGAAAISAALSGFVNGPIGPALAAGILATCRGVSVASATIEIITAILPRPADELVIAIQQAGTSPPTFRISVAAQMEKDMLCGGSGSFAVNRVRDLIVQRLSQRLTAWLSFGFIQNFPFLDRNGTLRGQIVDFMVNSVQSLASIVIDAVGLQDWLERKKNEFCSGVFGQGSIPIPIDELLAFGHDPVGDGTMTLPSAGTTDPAVFVCAAQSSGNGIVTVTASLAACGKVLSGRGHIDCRGVTVSFCQGDNGSALDDIFELVVDGDVLLAPSVPVRRVCGERILGPGDHVVELRGRAAPDNIGTYYLEVSPGRMTGPPLSGVDLTAGLVFRWTLRVDPARN